MYWVYLQQRCALWDSILSGTSSVLPILNTDVASSPSYLDLFKARFGYIYFIKQGSLLTAAVNFKV